MIGTQQARSAGTVAIMVVGLAILGSCASEPAPQPDNLVDRVIAQDAAQAAAASPLPKSYPDLRNVPARPKLGYTVEQRRQIQDALVGDLDYAKRSSELVRTTDGVAPPPPPPLPVLVQPAAAPAGAVTPRPPSKVQLIERRDTSGNLSSFLDDVVGVDPVTGNAADPSLTGTPRDQLSEPIPPAAGDTSNGGAAEQGDPASTEPAGLSSTLTGAFGQSSDTVVRETPPDAPQRSAGSAAAATGSPQRNAELQVASASHPLEVGRLWLFPLRPGENTPRPGALAPLLDAVAEKDALVGRHLSVTGRSADAGRASRLAADVVADLTRRGVPPSRIEVHTDQSNPGDAVVVSVLTAAP